MSGLGRAGPFTRCRAHIVEFRLYGIKIAPKSAVAPKLVAPDPPSLRVCPARDGARSRPARRGVSASPTRAARARAPSSSRDVRRGLAPRRAAGSSLSSHSTTTPRAPGEEAFFSRVTSPRRLARHRPPPARRGARAPPRWGAGVRAVRCTCSPDRAGRPLGVLSLAARSTALILAVAARARSPAARRRISNRGVGSATRRAARTGGVFARNRSTILISNPGTL